MSIPEILNFLSFSDPFLTIFLLVLLGMNTRKHTIVKERIWLSEIDYVQFKKFIGRQIFNPKIKPLRIAFSVDIILQQKVVL